MKRKSIVRIDRSKLSKYLAQDLPEFIFWNEGIVKAIRGDRVCVKWPGYDGFWFDEECLEAI